MFRKQLIKAAYRQVTRSLIHQRSQLRIPFQQFFGFSTGTQQYEFKAETKKLLDIVAKSLYTDKDVFLRELLSNASDALEKQRFMSAQKQELSQDDLGITIKVDEDKKVITIQDTGIGMTRDEMIDNLGTIARSGSRQFLQDNKNDTQIADKIIGQFGVGFYSCFIVGDTVEVTSRNDSDSKTHLWTSDGSGTFEIKEVEDSNLIRGTKIVIYLKPDCAHFAKKSEIEKTVQRYSNFISFPITLNEQKLNVIQAIWSRSRKDVTAEDYSKFYEYISNSKMNYRYKLHYQTDAPLSIKALLYVPSSHSERFGMQQEEIDLHLYSKKVLIKRNCREILPHYFRFVKGVVDCEDLPLNISRESYQDSALIGKLRSIVTKRLIRELETEATKDPDTYLAWYQEFQFFLKEGIASDQDNAQQLLSLLRFQHNKDDGHISLEEYVKKMTPGQDTIYFILSPSREHALNSPYLDPFKGTEIPVLFTYVHIDEMVFRTVDKFKNFRFVNIESNQEELQKNIKDVEHDTAKGLDSDDITPFSLWLKNELAPQISQVQVSKRLKDSPAIVVSALSSGMRQMMGMLDKKQLQQMSHNLTLEINPNHNLIVQLNNTRKSNMQVGSIIAKQLLDNCLLTSGLMEDPQLFVQRTTKLMEMIMATQKDTPQVETEQKASHKTQTNKGYEDVQYEFNEKVEIILDEHGNPSVKKM